MEQPRKKPSTNDIINDKMKPSQGIGSIVRPVEKNESQTNAGKFNVIGKYVLSAVVRLGQ